MKVKFKKKKKIQEKNLFIFFLVLLRATKKGTKHKDSNSLWQIIFDKPFYGGDSLLWNAPFRLQHAATSLYLAVRLKSTNHYAITLTDKVDSTTLFSFSPLKTVN